MRRMSYLSIFVALLAAGSCGLQACGAAEAGDPGETNESANTAEDLALAKRVLGLLGGEGGKCNGCHAATPTKVRAWGTAMRAVETECFEDASMTALERVSCLRSTPSDPASGFSPRKLGLYAAGTATTQFGTLFADAFPGNAAEASAQLAALRRAGMPRNGAPGLTAAEFAIVKGWVLRGMPQLDQAASGDVDASDSPATGDGGGDAGRGACTESTTPELRAHILEMRTGGWGARLADQTTPMFGCGAATSPLACLGSLPDLTAQVGESGVTQKIRKLRDLSGRSRYWVRSSADGRFVGLGFNTSARIVDLSKPASATPIAVRAKYDPFFLPSNDGFAFAGALADDNIRVCRQSLLADAAAATSPTISLTEPRCTGLGSQVYQSIGSSLDGARYFVTWGAHENDDGGNDITHPLPAAFSRNARTTFVPMVNDGAAYRAEAPVDVASPGEGDAMLSPSSRLVATRFSGGLTQGGYRIRAVEATRTGTGAGADAGGSLRVQTPLRAEICLQGAKANFSFDERFVATHQYVDTAQPDQASLADGSANVVVADLLTGARVRLTRMGAGQYALYPHFRADGWLYFLVRDMNANTEYLAATDATLRMPTP